jgi:hypothetical protein
MKRNYLVFSILLFLLMIFSLASNSTEASFLLEDQSQHQLPIQQQINLIKTHWQQQKPMKKINLMGEKTNKFLVAQSYLHYFSSVNKFLMTLNPKLSDSSKISLLKDSQDHLEKTKLDPYFSPPAFFTQSVFPFSRDLIDEKIIQTCFQMKNYSCVLKSVPFSSKTLMTKEEIIKIYGESLLKEKNYTELNLILRKYGRLFNEGELGIYKSKLIIQDQSEFKKNPFLNISPPSQTLPPRILKSFENKVDWNILIKAPFSQLAQQLFNEQKNNFSPDWIEFLYKNHEDLPYEWIESLVIPLWKRGHHELVKSVILSLIKKSEESLSLKTPKWHYEAGRIYEDLINYKKSKKYYKNVLELTDDPQYTELSYFRLGLINYIEKNNDEAKDFFSQYLSIFPEGKYATTVNYFLVQLKVITPEDYQKRYPNIFYSLLMGPIERFQNQTKIPFSNNFNFNWTPIKANPELIHKMKIIETLYQWGLILEAEQLLMELPLIDENNFGLTFWGLNHLLQTDHLKLSLHGSVQNINILLNKFPYMRSYFTLESLFPIFEFPLLSQITLQPALGFFVMSLIRQESAFNRYAISSAQAKGFMQLIDSTASENAQKLNALIEYQGKTFDIFKTEDNIMLGMENILSLLEKYQGRLDYALGAYNAGESIMNQWIKVRGHLPPILFIESIPYQETRGYIKNILRNLMVYQSLYGNKYDKFVTKKSKEEKIPAHPSVKTQDKYYELMFKNFFNLLF